MKGLFSITLDPQRVFGLDILRALAILFVVVLHGNFLLPDQLSQITDLFVFDGVSIFFVLSGFLVGGILIRAIDANGINNELVLNFWIRRWFRTLPNYFLVLLALCGLNFLFTDGFSFRSVSAYFLFSQNAFSVHPDFFPEAWSLSIEEWFYLLVPVLLASLTFMLRATPRTGILLTSILVILLVTSFRYYRYSTIPIDAIDWDQLFRKQVITRLDSLMFGVIGAYISFYHRKLWFMYKLPLFLFGVILFMLSKFVIPEFASLNGLYSTVFSFTVISIATLSLLPYLSELKTGRGPLYKMITCVSLISYSMYLINLSIVQEWIIGNIPWHNLTDNVYLMVISRYGLYWILVISLSILLYKYFEVPMTSLREKRLKRDLVAD
jgi:peptidoglycan/LPS O-acetylase OafA/YrhL